MSVRSTAGRWASTAFYTVTCDNPKAAYLAGVGLLLATMWFVMFSLGVVLGADIALDGGDLHSTVLEIHEIAPDTWSEFAEAGPLSRVVVGPLWWIIEISIQASLAGLYAGYFAPILGEVVASVAEPITLLFITIGVLNVARPVAAEVGWL